MYATACESKLSRAVAHITIRLSELFYKVIDKDISKEYDELNDISFNGKGNGKMGEKPMLYEIIYNDLKKAIEEGRLKKGQRILSEKELAEKYGVSRITSKHALGILAAENYISRWAGRGSFVEYEIKEIKLNKAEDKETTGLIGLILEDFSEAFGTYIISGVEKACQAHGYSMILKRSRGSQERERMAIQECRDLGTKGMIIMPVHGDNYNEEILKLALEKYPTILLDRKLKGIALPFVGTDNFRAAGELTEYLFAKGHRDICFVAPPAMDTWSVTEREAAFRAANAKRGILLDDAHFFSHIKSTLPGSLGQEKLAEDVAAIKRHLEKYPQITALLAVEYNIALVIKKAIKEMGRQKKEYEVVCFDGPENYIQSYEFTHIRQDEERMGMECVKQLDELIKGKNTKQELLLPGKIKKI